MGKKLTFGKMTGMKQAGDLISQTLRVSPAEDYYIALDTSRMEFYNMFGVEC